MDRSREFARAMLNKARDDQRILVALSRAADCPPWGLGFHAQQSVEKALKAVLASRSIRYPRTHDLGLLLDLLREAGLSQPPGADELPLLTPFGVMHRYPGDDPEQLPPGLDVRSILKLVDQTVTWAATGAEKDRNGA